MLCRLGYGFRYLNALSLTVRFFFTPIIMKWN